MRQRDTELVYIVFVQWWTVSTVEEAISLTLQVSREFVRSRPPFWMTSSGKKGESKSLIAKKFRREHVNVYRYHYVSRWPNTVICGNIFGRWRESSRPVYTRGRESLTHWGRVTHRCVCNFTTIGSGNGLSPGRRQAITWTNAGILLIGPLGTNFSEILIKIQTFSFRKMHLKTSSAKRRSFCFGLNVLKTSLSFQFKLVITNNFNL